MKNKNINRTWMLAVLIIALASCAKKLDLFPANDLTEAQVYSTAAGYCLSGL